MNNTLKQLILPLLAALTGIWRLFTGPVWIGVTMLIGSAVLMFLILKPKMKGRKLNGLACVALIAIFAIFATTACEQTINPTPTQIGYSSVAGHSYALVVQEGGSIGSDCVIDVLTTGTMALAAAVAAPATAAMVVIGWTLVGLNGAATINNCLDGFDTVQLWTSSRFMDNCRKSVFLSQDPGNGNLYNRLIECALYGWAHDRMVGQGLIDAFN